MTDNKPRLFITPGGANGVFTAPDGTNYNFTDANDAANIMATAGFGTVLLSGASIALSGSNTNKANEDQALSIGTAGVATGVALITTAAFLPPKEKVSGKTSTGEEFSYKLKGGDGYVENLDTLVELLKKYPDTEIIEVKNIYEEKGQDGKTNYVIENFSKTEMERRKAEGDGVIQKIGDTEYFVKPIKDCVIDNFNEQMKDYSVDEKNELQREFKLASNALKKLKSGGELTEKEKNQLEKEAKEMGLKLSYDNVSRPTQIQVTDTLTEQSFTAYKDSVGSAVTYGVKTGGIERK